MVRCINRSRSYYTRFLFFARFAHSSPKLAKIDGQKTKKQRKNTAKKYALPDRGGLPVLQDKNLHRFLQNYSGPNNRLVQPWLLYPATLYRFFSMEHSVSVRILFALCSYFVRLLFALCSPFVRSLFALCSLFVRLLFADCSLFVRLLFAVCMGSTEEHAEKTRRKNGPNQEEAMLMSGCLVLNYLPQ